MIAANIEKINQEIGKGARLIAVSKTKPVPDLLEAYAAGQRLFGENKVQEMVSKQTQLPADVQWHLIGHLQRNKVKYIAPFVAMIHAVDSLSLLKEIEKEAAKNNRIIPVLLQVFIAEEETKFGLNEEELYELLNEVNKGDYAHVQISGLMGMATNTTDQHTIRQEFKHLKQLFDIVKEKYFTHLEYFKEISMGMSSDYPIAVEEGATLVRVGSLIFGERG